MTDLAINSAVSFKLHKLFEGRHLFERIWHKRVSGETFELQSPSHEHVTSRPMLGGEAEDAVAAMRAAIDCKAWSRASGKGRTSLLSRVADLTGQNKGRIALNETLERGKLIDQSRREVASAADLWRYADSLTRRTHACNRNSPGQDMEDVVLKQPISEALINTLWNFSFWILSQKLLFALAAHRAVVVKPSETTPSTTLMLGKSLIKAGLPGGLCDTIPGYGVTVGSVLCRHAAVDMISFTGSKAVGKTLSAAASDTHKKVALETVARDSQLIFPHTELDAAVDAVVFGVCFNVGQRCNSSRWTILHEVVSEAFQDRFVALSRRVKFDGQLNSTAQVEAVETSEHNSKIDAYVTHVQSTGANIAPGGDRSQIAGMDDQFDQPTVVTQDLPIARDEVFSRVLSVLTFKTLDETVALINDGAYSLSAGSWSANVHTCLDFTRRAETGTVWTNTWMEGFTKFAFSVIKQSGQRQEIGRYGFEKFLEVNSVVMRIGNSRAPWVPSGTRTKKIA